MILGDVRGESKDQPGLARCVVCGDWEQPVGVAGLLSHLRDIHLRVLVSVTERKNRDGGVVKEVRGVRYKHELRR